MANTLVPDMPNALCLNFAADMWHSWEGQYARAQRICSTCPERVKCLDYAIENDVSGVWGGTTHPERVAFRDVSGIVANPVEASDYIPKGLVYVWNPVTEEVEYVEPVEA